MTQDVQPLTWSKRTNIEEHQQFFSKINEIIGNLAPTVDEAEQAIAQATAAIASANDAVATANAASAAASAAASQAQTAASTVAGYNTRLIAVEDEAAGNTANITDLQDRIGTAEGKITAIEGREADYLKKTGAAQTVTSQIMVPTTATGLRDTQIANGTRIQNDLDAYEPMIRNTGNQIISGVKDFVSGVDGQDYYHPCHVDNSADNIWKDIISFDYKNDRSCIFDIISMFNNNDVQNARIKIRMQGGGVGIQVIESEGTTEAMAKASNYVVTLTGTVVTIKAYKRRRYTDLGAKLLVWHNYQTVEAPPKITYPNATCADPSTETFDSMAVGSIVPYRNVN